MLHQFILHSKMNQDDGIFQTFKKIKMNKFYIKVTYFQSGFTF